MAHINKARISLNSQYQGKSTIIDNKTDIIRKIHISLGTGLILLRSLYFHGVSSIQNLLNKSNHKTAMIVEINIVHHKIINIKQTKD